MALADSGFLAIGAQRLEYRMIGPRPDAAPTLVLLHEGLGCVGLWGDFPEKLHRRPAAGVFVYSRAGYGQSSPVHAAAAAHRTCTTKRARRCRQLLDAIGFQRGLLIGHSDGASIAAIYAGSHQDHRVGGAGADRAAFLHRGRRHRRDRRSAKAYETGDLRARLSRWHADVDNAFKGWNGAWLDPDFRKWDITEYLAYIRVPMLIVQGEDDQYGTVKQIEVARAGMLLPGRGRAAAGRAAFAAARGAGGDAQGDFEFLSPAYCVATK